VSTAFAVCRQGLTDPYLAELVVGLGEVPVTDGFAMLSTDQVPQSIVPFLPDHNAVLLCNHGAVTWGADLWSAFDRMETVEHTAKILLHVRQLGGGVPLTKEEVAQLKGLDGFYRQRRGRREKP
jgi:L-fuculose-phosphate aldolase